MKKWVTVGWEIGTEGLYRSNAHVWRATDERNDAIGTVYNGGSWETER